MGRINASAGNADTPLRQALREEGRMQLWLTAQLWPDATNDELRRRAGEVSDWVRGVHTPVASTRTRIAETLGRREDELWPEAGSDEVAA